MVAIYLSAGQGVGHCTLVLASGHSHDDHWPTAMMVGHLLAAAGGAALICAVERLFGALTGRIWRLFVAMAALPASEERRGAAPVLMPREPWCPSAGQLRVWHPRAANLAGAPRPATLNAAR